MYKTKLMNSTYEVADPQKDYTVQGGFSVGGNGRASVVSLVIVKNDGEHAIHQGTLSVNETSVNVTFPAEVENTAELSGLLYATLDKIKKEFKGE